MTAPLLSGRDHWLEAERLLAGDTHPGVLYRAEIHALLALSAPAYAFHQSRGDVVATSPNILTGKDEGPQAVVAG